MRNRFLATLFVFTIWMTLLFFMVSRMYSNFLDENNPGSLGFNIKSVKELLDGNP